MTPKNYDKNFFVQHQEPSYKSALKLLPLVLQYINPRSVLDIGCGTGAWLKAFNELTGIDDYMGVDGSYVNKSYLLIDSEKFREADLERNLQVNRKFDLVVCMEVAEHLHQQFANAFIKNLVNISDIILFSAALPGQEGTFHFNEQFPEYWAKKFSDHGYKCLDIIREKIWNDHEISFWYRQNAVLYVKKEVLEQHAALKAVSKSVDITHLTRIHPELWMHKVNKSNFFEAVAKSWINFFKYKLFAKKLY